MSGLVTGLQNRLHPFESGRYLNPEKELPRTGQLLFYFPFFGSVDI